MDCWCCGVRESVTIVGHPLCDLCAGFPSKEDEEAMQSAADALDRDDDDHIDPSDDGYPTAREYALAGRTE